MSRRPDHTFRATGAGEPDIGVGLLHRFDPGIDGTIMIVLAFVAKWPRSGPALDDQVVGLLEPLEVLRRVNAAMQALHRGAAHKARDDAPARKAIEHGDLLRHAHRVVDGNDVTEDRDLGLLGDLTDNGGIDVYRWLHAPVGRVVFIAHDAVEADLIGECILFMILIIQNMSLLWIEVCVWKT